jgi:hypothetical protein
MASVQSEVFVKKYRVLVRGENFLMTLDGEDQKLGFYTTVFVEAQDQEDAELKAMDLLRNNEKLVRGVRNPKSDPPMMFVEEIEGLKSLPGLTEIGFCFFQQGESEAACN